MDLSQSDSDAPAASTSRGAGRRKSHKSAERVDTDEDESDEVDGGKDGAAAGKASDENPYPVEGIYKDSAERSRCVEPPLLSFSRCVTRAGQRLTLASSRPQHLQAPRARARGLHRDAQGGDQ